MSWLIQTLGSSIGKKLMMAFSGLGFCGFLGVHLAGNLSLYAGAASFNAYAAHLHSYGPIILVAEYILLFLALVHVATGITLFWLNFSARPTGYAVNKRAGGRTWGSITMPYTGIIMLFFIIWHLTDFHFVDKNARTIFDIVSDAFAQPGRAIFYTLAMIAVALHVSHGLWSAFQTLGLNHIKYTTTIKTTGLAFSLIVGIGFGLIPLYFLFTS